MFITKLQSWNTPASFYPRATFGSVRVIEEIYEAGFYEAYGTGPDHESYRYYEAVKSISVTCLEIEGKIHMVDDPPHWWGMQAHAECLAGNVIIAGLGLGLILHALKKNPRVSSVTVVERSKDVIQAISPHIPPDTRLINADWYDFVPSVDIQYDSVFFDLFVGNGEELQLAALREMFQLRDRFPNAHCRIHGFHNDSLNRMVDTMIKAVADGTKFWLEKLSNEKAT